MSKEKIQSYINNFRRRLARYLKPGFGLLCNIYPADNGGAVLEFNIGSALENDDVYHPKSKSLGSALSKIEQHAFGGDLEGFSFGGTNTILEGNRIIYVKAPDFKEWSDSAAAKDVSALFENSKRGGK